MAAPPLSLAPIPSAPPHNKHQLTINVQVHLRICVREMIRSFTARTLTSGLFCGKNFSYDIWFLNFNMAHAPLAVAVINILQRLCFYSYLMLYFRRFFLFLCLRIYLVMKSTRKLNSFRHLLDSFFFFRFISISKVVLTRKRKKGINR